MKHAGNLSKKKEEEARRRRRPVHQLPQVHVQRDRRLHGGWDPMAGRAPLRSRSRVAGKRRGARTRCERESVVDWMDVFLPLPSPPWRPFYSGQLV
jgi:hypothetical protein